MLLVSVQALVLPLPFVHALFVQRALALATSIVVNAIIIHLKTSCSVKHSIWINQYDIEYLPDEIALRAFHVPIDLGDDALFRVHVHVLFLALFPDRLVLFPIKSK